MAGYAGFSMSNNAVVAYDDGLRPASKIKQVPAILIERFVKPREWHHSSKAYNRVNFYAPAEVLAIFGIAPSCDEDGDVIEANLEAVAALAALKNERKAAADVHIGMTVEWIEWTGSLKRPTANPRKENGCTVAIKGQTATITTPSGDVITKRLTTRGFFFRSDAA